MLNAKKLVFPLFSFNINEEAIESSPGFIAWSDLRLIYDEECKPGVQKFFWNLVARRKCW